MKYKDPVTGEMKTLSVKAADTLPIGTIVDYDGDTVPDGWETVDPIQEIELPALMNNAELFAGGTYDSYYKIYENIANIFLCFSFTSSPAVNTEIKIMDYEFPFVACGVITKSRDTGFVGTFIINKYGVYVNFKENPARYTMFLNAIGIIENEPTTGGGHEGGLGQ